MNKKWHLWRWFVLVSILSGIVLAIFQPTLNDTANPDDFAWPAIVLRFFSFAPLCFFALALLVVLLKFGRIIFQRLFTWCALKWFLRALAALMILLVLLYVEENWRGKRAWENYKHELEATGERFDFASFVPPPVPDDQNFALTPIVANCYAGRLHWSPNEDGPTNTNLPVNRLEMKTYRVDNNGSTNLHRGSWQRATFTDLKAWQDYFRAMFITNRSEMGMPSPPLPNGMPSSAETNETEKIIALATNQFPFTAQPQPPAADVLFALSKYGPAIEELREASRLSYSRFPLNYDVHPVCDISLPHLQPIKNCAQVLQLRSVAELADGQTEKAFDDVELILRLANSIRDEPLTISQLVRVSILNFALQPIWEGLAEHKWSDAQLAAFENESSGFDFLSSYQLVVRAQRTFAIDVINDIMKKQNIREVYRGLLADEQEESSLDWRGIAQASLLYLMPHGWFYQNDLFVARIFQQSLLTDAEIKQQIISPSAVRRSTEIIMGEFKQRHFNDLFVSGVFPPLARDAKQMAFGQVSADLARTACALERYRLAHGEYPETLDTLAPQFIETFPHDIINGQPLHYRREANGQFVLYSVGWNETDDGGQVVLTNNGLVDREKGDWVWQYPQK